MYAKYILVIFSFFVLSSSIYADNNNSRKDSIKALVEKVKKAEPSQRRLLMNELKTQLKSMHQTIRTQIMLDLRHSFNGMQVGQNIRCDMKSSMNNQNMMSMTTSKQMQENMARSSSGREKPTLNNPTSNSTYKNNPMRGK